MSDGQRTTWFVNGRLVDRHGKPVEREPAHLPIDATTTPDSWQWRSQNKEGMWSLWTELPEDSAISKASENRLDIQVRPLFTHPPKPTKAEELVRLFLAANDETKYGLADCLDNSGKPYQSQSLAETLAAARALFEEEEKSNGPDEEIVKFLEGVVGVVEANSYETLCLWKEETGERKTSWIDDTRGILEVIGHIGDLPVCISLRTATVDGHKILFVDPTSRVVDHEMVQLWLEKNLPKSAFEGNYINRADAMNFYNVIKRVEWRKMKERGNEKT